MNISKSFKKFIDGSKYFDTMLKFIGSETNLCPSKDKVFRFLEADVEKTKCIIVGMDPYSSTYYNGYIECPVATGRAFEVADVRYWTDKYRQASLSNIFKALCNLKFRKVYSIEELRKMVTKDNFRYIDIHDWFDAMEEEGVIFLNATLTTKAHITGAHIDIWTDFMNELIKFIVDVNSDIKWMLWGASAKERIGSFVRDDNIIYSCHPATRVNNTFAKDCCFKKVKSIKWV